MALRVVLASAMESEEPTIRNSNLLPVKAKGEVRLRSVASFLMTGTVDTPVVQLAGGQQLDGVGVGDDLADHVVQLVAQEDGDDGGRRLLGTQAVLVAGVGGGAAQQVGVLIHRLHDAGEDQQELEIFVGGIAGIQQILAVVGAQWTSCCACPSR